MLTERSSQVRLVAIRLFAERGFAATGIREIAEAAGIASSMLYHYFGNKDQLLLGIMHDGIRLTIDAAETAIADLTRPDERLSVLAQSHVAVQSLSPLGATVTDTEMRSLAPDAAAEITALRDKYEELWGDTLEVGLKNHLFMAEDATLTRLALIDMCNGPARWYRWPGRLSLETVMQRYSDLALATARARRDGEPVTTAQLDIPEPAVLIEIVERGLFDAFGESVDRAQPVTTEMGGRVPTQP